jgi:hypothetical protein
VTLRGDDVDAQSVSPKARAPVGTTAIGPETDPSPEPPADSIDTDPAPTATVAGEFPDEHPRPANPKSGNNVTAQPRPYRATFSIALSG